jgi:hypothetical protein
VRLNRVKSDETNGPLINRDTEEGCITCSLMKSRRMK